MNEHFFDFDRKDIERYIEYELLLFDKIDASFDYVFNKLVLLNHHSNISKLKSFDINTITPKETKNYNWLGLTHKNVRLIIRQYGYHLTIYYNHTEDNSFRKNNGALIFNINLDNVNDNDRDSYYDNPFLEINKVLFNLIELINNNHDYLLWNGVSFKRPDFCDVQNIYFKSVISSYDLLIFCSEELSNIHMTLFSENDMLDKLKTMDNKINMPFENSIIKEIKTEFSGAYLDPYYHELGITIENKNGKTKFIDVYSLTMYYYNEIFK